MSYCDLPHWISDYNFSKAMAYRISQAEEPVLAAAFASSARNLLIWGGVNEIADAEGGSFAFILPARGDWPDRLSRITLSGPEGVATIGGEDEMDASAATLLLDPATGRVRGILRDWPDQDVSVASARRMLPEPGLVIITSKGVPESNDW